MDEDKAYIEIMGTAGSWRAQRNLERASAQLTIKIAPGDRLLNPPSVLLLANLLAFFSQGGVRGIGAVFAITAEDSMRCWSSFGLD